MIVPLLKPFGDDKFTFDYCYPTVNCIILPADWWLKHSTTNYQISTLFLQFNKNLPIERLSKPNTLEVAQVDYLMKEYKYLSELRKRKHEFVKYSIYLLILLIGWIVIIVPCS